MWDLATGTPVGGPFTGHDDAVNAVAVGGAGRPPGGHLRQRRPDGAGVGPGHRRPGRRPVHRPRRRGARGGGRRSWTAARWSSPAATTGRCGCGTWPPAPRSATRSPATATGCGRWRRPSWTAARWSSPAAATGRCGCGTWPPATPVGDPFTGHGGWVQAVAAAELDGRPVVISGGSDGTVRVWDLATGDPGRWPVHRPRRRGARGGGRGAGRPARGHLRQRRRDGAGVGPGHRRPRSVIRSPATTARCSRWRSAELEGRPVVISGSGDADGAGVGPGHRRPRSATRSPATTARCSRWRSAELDGRPVVISGSDDRTVRVWDLATGDPGRRPVHRPRRRGARGGGRRSWTAARWSSPAAATGRCGCGTWPPAPRSATRSPATAVR